MFGRWSTVAFVLAVLAAGCTTSAGGGRAAAGTAGPAERPSNPFFTAPFAARTNRFTFGQDPSFTADGRVLSNEDDPTGTKQIYVSALDGAAMKCLTCAQPGPNGFPQERPQGDWVLFCSWRGQPVTFGAPCLGGIGTDLYVMRPDGTRVTRLSAPGMAFEAGRVPYDNYHPYWSPDGDRIVWTHLDFADQHGGGTQWTMLVADFVAAAGAPPHLANVRVVGPSGATAYETQAWAPDGSGFLYTLFTSAGDPAAGWLNTELYFMRLAGHGASLDHPQPVHLTDDNPGWDEQAVFTPDMRDVIWMSSRAAPTWYQTVVTAAAQFGFSPPMQNEVAGPMFVLTILDPHFHTDLYMLDLSTHAVRRLTARNAVVPEFVFDPAGTQLLWSDGAGDRATLVGRFTLGSKPKRVGPRVAAAAAWAGAPRDAPVISPPATPTTGASRPGFDARHVPSSVVEGLTLLESQLHDLATRLGGLPSGPTCCRTPVG